MRITLLIIGLSLSAGAAAASEMHHYPTQDTVTMVINCMDNLGGQSEYTLYTCSCRHDVIARQLDYDTWEKASLYVRYKHMPGENGGVFRDMPEGQKLEAILTKAQEKAKGSCPVVKHLDAPSLQRQRQEIHQKMLEQKMSQ